MRQRESLLPPSAKAVLPMQRLGSTPSTHARVVRVTICTLGLAYVVSTAVGCAAPKPASSPQSTTTGAAGPMHRAAPMQTQQTRNEVLALMGQVRDFRVRAGLPGAEPDMSTSGDGATCDAATEGTCGDVCKLSEDICDNKDRICEIAETETDPWFSQQCGSAKASCHEAQRRCCGCED